MVNSNKGSGDVVIIGGDFNAHNYGSTMTTLQNTYGYNIRASDWVDHILTKGSGLDATPAINIIKDTGSDHDGVKVTWSSGISGGSGSGSGSGTGTGTSNCGDIPSSCSSDLQWAVNSGKSCCPQYYQNFQDVTGVALSSASQSDMITYWVCTYQNPNGNCGGLQIPCGRSCYARLEFSDNYYPHIVHHESEDDDRNDTQWILFGVGLGVIILFCCAVGGIFYFKRRRKTIVAVGDEDAAVEQDGKGWDMSPINTTNDGQTETGKAEEEEVLEVDVEMETNE